MSADPFYIDSRLKGETSTGKIPYPIPYPDTLFVTKDDALRTKARIDQLNAQTAQDASHPVGGCADCAAEAAPTKAVNPSLVPGGEDAYYCEQLRQLLQSKVRRLYSERDTLRDQMREIDQRQQRLYRLIDDLR